MIGKGDGGDLEMANKREQVMASDYIINYTRTEQVMASDYIINYTCTLAIWSACEKARVREMGETI